MCVCVCVCVCACLNAPFVTWRCNAKALGHMVTVCSAGCELDTQTLKRSAETCSLLIFKSANTG